MIMPMIVVVVMMAAVMAVVIVGHANLAPEGAGRSLQNRPR